MLDCRVLSEHSNVVAVVVVEEVVRSHWLLLLLLETAMTCTIVSRAKM
jgi:hypothetical protein